MRLIHCPITTQLKLICYKTGGRSYFVHNYSPTLTDYQLVTGNEKWFHMSKVKRFVGPVILVQIPIFPDSFIKITDLEECAALARYALSESFLVLISNLFNFTDMWSNLFKESGSPLLNHLLYH